MAPEMTGSHERRESHDLIGSDKVEGTNVYRSNGEKIGEIERIMLEKRSGKVAYAVMSFGGCRKSRISSRALAHDQLLPISGKRACAGRSRVAFAHFSRFAASCTRLRSDCLATSKLALMKPRSRVRSTLRCRATRSGMRLRSRK